MPGLSRRVGARITGSWEFAKRAMETPERQAALRTMSARLRVLPNFLLIGAQKSGTTTLAACLDSHPNVLRAATKEVHFFDVAYPRGLLWYRSHFATVLTKLWHETRFGSPVVTGDASPYYICCPHVPQRVCRDLPEVRLLVILRNPVDRAYSHYRHEVGRGRETLSFEDALGAESARLEGEWERMVNEPDYVSSRHRHFSYRMRGHYADQLDDWLAHFPRSRLLVLGMEEFLADTRTQYRNVQDFLGLPQHPLARLPKRNVDKNKSPMATRIREQLVEYFEPHNRRLYGLVGREFEWDR